MGKVGYDYVVGVSISYINCLKIFGYLRLF